MPNLLFFPVPLPSPAAEISSSLYWESARVCRDRRGQGGEGDEVGEGHGVQKLGGCEGRNLACRERGEVKEVFVKVVNEKEELVSKVHGSCRQARGAGKKAFGDLQ